VQKKLQLAERVLNPSTAMLDCTYWVCHVQVNHPREKAANNIVGRDLTKRDTLRLKCFAIL